MSGLLPINMHVQSSIHIPQFHSSVNLFSYPGYTCVPRHAIHIFIQSLHLCPNFHAPTPKYVMMTLQKICNKVKQIYVHKASWCFMSISEECIYRLPVWRVPLDSLVRRSELWLPVFCQCFILAMRSQKEKGVWATH